MGGKPRPLTLWTSHSPASSSLLSNLVQP
jgi:hypothetical protein